MRQTRTTAVDLWLTELTGQPGIDTSTLAGNAIALEIDGIRRYLVFSHTGCTWQDAEIPVKFEILLTDLVTAQDVFGSMPGAFQAFQENRFRSTGYLMRTFSVLRTFHAKT